MKKILILNGSPKKERGNSIKLAKTFIQGYLDVEKHTEVEYVHTYTLEVKNCSGCFSCWKQTPGECIFHDDMEALLQKILEADIILWVTPLYHYGMSASLKKVIERTLPFNEPYIVKEQSGFTHPPRYETKAQKNILISTCGFPHHSAFETLVEIFNKIIPQGLDESILCVMGELLSVKPLKKKVQWYLDVATQAGRAYAKDDNIPDNLKEQFMQPLVPVDDFIEMANLSWNVKENTQQPFVKKMSESKRFLTLMKHSYTGTVEKPLSIEFDFTDTDEIYHFNIHSNECELVEGKSPSPSLRIITPFSVWEKIAEGELSGSQAMMDGLYRAEGEMELLMNLGEMFGASTEETLERTAAVAPANGEKWMAFPLFAWILFWSISGSSYTLGVLLPSFLMLGLYGVKKIKHYEMTFLENSTLLFFTMAGILSLQGLNIGLSASYFIVAAVWMIGVFNPVPLTGEYSKHRFKKSLTHDPIFLKINRELTLLWAATFLLQGGIKVLFPNLETGYFITISLMIIVISMKITQWYPEYFQRKIMQQNQNKT